MMSGSRSHSIGDRDRSLRLVELTSVGIVAIIALAFARPLLEEWSFIDYFNRHGASGIFYYMHGSPLRPLAGLPHLLQWLMSGGTSAGYAIGYALMLVAHFYLTRWAISGFIAQPAAWVVCLLSTLLVPWPGQWHMRISSSSHLCVMLLVLALGAALRYRRHMQWRWFAMCVGAVFLTNCVYQALAVCCLILPFAILLAGDQVPWGTRSENIRRIVLAFSPAMIGLALYALYSAIVTSIQGTSGYEGVVLESTNRPSVDLHGSWEVVSSIYSTTYVDAPYSILVAVSVLSCLVGPRLSAGTLKTERAGIAMLFGAFVMLPLTALPYAVNLAYLNDPERVIFPVAVGFVIISVIMLARAESNYFNIGVLRASVLSAALLFTTAASAVTSYANYRIANTALVTTEALARSTNAKSVLLRDYTGTLGDVLTLYPPALEIALRARGIRLNAELCTPKAVDRIHPDARQLQIISTPRCEDVNPLPDPAIILEGKLDKKGDLLIVQVPL